MAHITNSVSLRAECPGRRVSVCRSGGEVGGQEFHGSIFMTLAQVFMLGHFSRGRGAL